MGVLMESTNLMKEFPEPRGGQPQSPSVAAAADADANLPKPKKKWIRNYLEAEPASPVSPISTAGLTETTLPFITATPRNGLTVVVQPRPAACTPVLLPVPTSVMPVLQQVHTAANINGLSTGAAGLLAGLGSATSPSLLGQRITAGTREVHNKLEKNRRAHLKECFELLSRQLPPTNDDKKSSNLAILGSAIRFIQVLRRKERESEHEMERLAREKIAAQQILAALRRQAAIRRRGCSLSDQTPHKSELMQIAGQLEEMDESEFAEGMNTATSVITTLSDNIRDVKKSPSPPTPTSRVSPPPINSQSLYDKTRLQAISHHQVVNVQSHETVVKSTNLYKVSGSTTPRPMHTVYPGLNGLSGLQVASLAGVSLAGVTLASLPVSVASSYVSVAPSSGSVAPSYVSIASSSISLAPTSATMVPSSNATAVSATPGILNLSAGQTALPAARKQVSSLTITSMGHVQGGEQCVPPLSVGPSGVVVGGALQLLPPGALRVLHAPHLTPIDLQNSGGSVSTLQRHNGARVLENGHATPPPQGDNHPTGIVVSGLTPLMMSQSGAHILTSTPHVNGKMVGRQYLPTTLVKPLVVVSSSNNGSTNT